MIARLRRPLGLRARLILLLSGALLAAQVATVLLFLDERGRAVRVAAAEEVAGRTLALADTLDRLSPRARNAALERVRARRIGFSITAAPLVRAGEAERRPRLAARIEAATGGDGRELRVALRERATAGRDGRPGPLGSRHHGRDALVVSAALADGSWLNARAGVRAPPVQWAWPALTSFALAAVAVAGVVWLAVGRILRPMGALAGAADRLGTGEKPAPLPLTGPAEARRLADAFNRMADRLTHLLDERARTLAAIGHDLRSPVTAMRLRVEMVDDDETRARLTVCLDEIETLVEAALALARGAGAEEPRRRRDLARLLRSVVDDLRDSGAAAELEARADVSAEVRPAALKRALRNLAENAARYGGVARLALARDGAVARITIDDDGPGIPRDQRDRVFEPFVRLEASRSRETGGTGLGLAIARAAIEAHGGDIVLGDAPGGGTRATVTLPLALSERPARRSS